MTKQKILIAFLVLISLVSCQKKSQNEANKPITSATESTSASNPSLTISCQGIGDVQLSYNYQQLQEIFGNKVSEIQTGHDGDYCYVALTPQDTVTVLWDDEQESGKKIWSLSVSSPNFKTEQGIHPQMDIKNIEQKIGKSFQIAYQEEVRGIFMPKNSVGECWGGTFFGKDNQALEEVFPDKLKKMQNFSSNDADLQKITCILGIIEVSAN